MVVDELFLRKVYFYKTCDEIGFEKRIYDGMDFDKDFLFNALNLKTLLL